MRTFAHKLLTLNILTMKRFYLILSALFLLLCGSSPAAAQYQVADEPSATLLVGQDIVLRNGRGNNGDISGSTQYLKYFADASANDFWASTATEDCILQIVDAGIDGDKQLYSFKHVKTGSYIEAFSYNASTDYKLHWTNNSEHALKVTVEEGTTQDELYTAFAFKSNETIFGTSNIYMTPLSPFAGSVPGITTFHNAGFFYYDAWLIYEVEKLSGRSELQNLVDTYFPNGVTRNTWKVGTNPGAIATATYNTLLAAYNHAQSVLSNASASDSEISTATDSLRNNYNKALASMVPMAEGYYFFKNYFTGGFATFNENGENVNTIWTTFDAPDVYDEGVDNFIWKFEANTDGNYIITNMATGRVLSSGTSENRPVPLLENSDYAGYFRVSYQGSNPEMVQGYFNMKNMRAGGRTLYGLYDGFAIGYGPSNDEHADAALWDFIAVPDEFIQTMEENKNKAARLDELSEWIDKTEQLYAKSKVYDSPVKLNGTLDTPGLIAEVTTNAQEPSEGDVRMSYDSDAFTFFHSNWSADSIAPANYHYLQAKLSQPLSTFALKLVKRIFENGGSYYSNSANPETFTILATNDTLDATSWQTIGTYKAVYNYDLPLYEGAVEESQILRNYVSVNFIEMPAAYKFVRMAVNSTPSNSLCKGYPYFNIAEIGIFDAQYDSENSAFETIPDSVKQALATALEKAKTELEAEEATQATIDQLKAAYAAFDDAFADSDELMAMLQEARSYLDAALEDDELLGYYATGSTDTFGKNLDTIEDRLTDMTSPSLEEYAAMKSEIEKAMAEFDTKLNKPAGDKLYFIQSASGLSSVYEHYVMAFDNSLSAVNLSREDVVASPGQHLNYMWRIEPQADNTYVIRNAATGTYMGAGTTVGAPVNMATAGAAIKLRSARAANGAFNFEVPSGLFITTPSYVSSLTLAAEAMGQDGAAFNIVPVDDYQGCWIRRINSSIDIVTMPFDVSASSTEGTNYKVLGIKDNALQLAVIDDYETIPAGTPFIFVANEGMSEMNIYSVEDEDGLAIEYVVQPTSQNGLVGTLLPTRIESPMGIVRNGQVDLAASSGTPVSANSGYFDLNAIPATTEQGAHQLPLSSDVINGIETIDLPAANAAQGIYNLQGVRLPEGQALPKGVYIIGGKKVIK